MIDQTSESPNPAHWSLHDSHPDLVASARAKLSEVVDPEIHLNIIQLGLVRDIAIENGIGHVSMVLTTPFCPYGPALIEMTREKAVEALQVPVSVELRPEQWDFSMMEDPSAMDWGMYT